MMNTATSASMRITLEAASGDQVSLGSYPTYAQAQSVIEILAGQEFEVETTEIIGSDLRMVEQVTGAPCHVPKTSRLTGAGQRNGRHLGPPSITEAFRNGSSRLGLARGSVCRLVRAAQPFA